LFVALFIILWAAVMASSTGAIENWEILIP
jgi:hypothetical protein